MTRLRHCLFWFLRQLGLACTCTLLGQEARMKPVRNFVLGWAATVLAVGGAQGGRPSAHAARRQERGGAALPQVGPPRNVRRRLRKRRANPRLARWNTVRWSAYARNGMSGGRRHHAGSRMSSETASLRLAIQSSIAAWSTPSSDRVPRRGMVRQRNAMGRSMQHICNTTTPSY